ncbi:Anthranilate phosphoribosyltransferase [Aureliella helgolandensis]|uniref:Anthranilate phosphoribosyltransferase n=2 Tax=Aureliella helgolandensis TaxID=2527968 RepID=A0A518G8X1_9BACT|nr:Anthranilate phosphoribosyltransferase [Aureliella helgolandensis]
MVILRHCVIFDHTRPAVLDLALASTEPPKLIARLMSHDFSSLLATLQSHQNLSRPEMHDAIGWLLSGDAEPEAMRKFLVLLAEKGETVDELTGAASALRDSMRPVKTTLRPLVDTCGTGGDGSQTFNISTAAALAIAAAGVPVAKHGNRKITSSTGSADVLQELGIDLLAPPETVESCLESLGICFCFAPHYHPAMKHVGPVRQSIPHPTIFNRLGPLANPAAADRQVLGVGAEELVDVMAGALQQLGTQRSVVVRGHDGVDEISLTSPTRVLEITPQGIEEHLWTPADFGLPASDRSGLFADDPISSAACIRAVFDGEKGPKRDVVVLNAAAGLWVADVSADLKQCAAQVADAIDSGQARNLLQSLAQATHHK